MESSAFKKRPIDPMRLSSVYSGEQSPVRGDREHMISRKRILNPSPEAVGPACPVAHE